MCTQERPGNSFTNDKRPHAPRPSFCKRATLNKQRPNVSPLFFQKVCTPHTNAHAKPRNSRGDAPCVSSPMPRLQSRAHGPGKSKQSHVKPFAKKKKLPASWVLHNQPPSDFINGGTRRRRHKKTKIVQKSFSII